LLLALFAPSKQKGVFRSHASTEVLRPFYVDCFAYHFFSCHLTLRLSIDSTGASTGNDLDCWRGAAAATAKFTGPWRKVLPDAAVVASAAASAASASAASYVSPSYVDDAFATVAFVVAATGWDGKSCYCYR